MKIKKVSSLETHKAHSSILMREGDKEAGTKKKKTTNAAIGIVHMIITFYLNAIH